MTIEQPVEVIVAQPIGARALQQRLYREIGLAAVAAALEAGDAVATVTSMERHTAAMLVGKAPLTQQGKAA